MFHNAVICITIISHLSIILVMNAAFRIFNLIEAYQCFNKATNFSLRGVWKTSRVCHQCITHDVCWVSHDDVIEWKHFTPNWPFVRGIHRFPTQRPVTRSFDIFFDLRLNKRLSKQPWGWWFETPSWSLWRQCNECLILPLCSTRFTFKLYRVSNTLPIAL